MHNEGCLTFTKMFPFNNEMKQFSSFAVLKNKETHVIPLPDLMKFYNIWMIKNFENVYLIDKSGVVLNFFLLNCLNCKFLFTFSMFR